MTVTHLRSRHGPTEARSADREGRGDSRFRLEGSSGPLDPAGHERAERIAARLSGRNPAVAAPAVGAVAYVVLLAVLVALGRLLTGVLLDGPLGAWDRGAVDWLVERRAGWLDAVSTVGSSLADTITIVGVASVVASVLLVRRWAQGAVLLATALFTEVAVFLSLTLLVPRDRPAVPKLDHVPPTSSFPSGHVAASIALFVCLGLICRARIRSPLLCRLTWTLALVVPVVVAWARMYRGMHHPTDVLAGGLLGVGCVVAAVLATRVALLLARQRHDAAGEHAGRPA